MGQRSRYTRYRIKALAGHLSMLPMDIVNIVADYDVNDDVILVISAMRRRGPTMTVHNGWAERIAIFRLGGGTRRQFVDLRVRGIGKGRVSVAALAKAARAGVHTMTVLLAQALKFKMVWDTNAGVSMNVKEAGVYIFHRLRGHM